MESLRDADVTLDLESKRACSQTYLAIISSPLSLFSTLSLSLSLSLTRSLARSPSPSVAFRRPSTQIPLSDNLDLRQTPRPARKPLPTSDNIDSIQRNLLSHSRSSCPFDFAAVVSSCVVERSLLTRW